ncbi:MAG: hypothetical protein MPN21_12360 [Thermoanaerobaculia bacterium]|nr:hypothetical protein [Thermoanaerobaculia bacterium]
MSENSSGLVVWTTRAAICLVAAMAATLIQSSPVDAASQGVPADPDVDALRSVKVLQLAAADGAAAVVVNQGSLFVVGPGDRIQEEPGGLRITVREVLEDRLVVEIRSGNPRVPLRRAWIFKEALAPLGGGAGTSSRIRILDPRPPALPMPSQPRIVEEPKIPILSGEQGQRRSQREVTGDTPSVERGVGGEDADETDGGDGR